MTKLSSKILDKIKKDKVTPRPRWYFMLMQTLLGIAILTSIIIGGIAVAIVIRHFSMTDWEMARLSSGGHLQSVLYILPYIWLVLLGLTILLADLLFKHTKKGYRFEPWKLVAVSIALSVICGSLFFYIEIDEPLEAGLRNNLPVYVQWERMRDKMFAAPERGVLAGEIIEINPEEEWIIVDFRNRKWIVDVSNALIPKDFPFGIGMPVGIIGEIIEENLFRADIVRPWRKEMIIKISERKILK